MKLATMRMPRLVSKVSTAARSESASFVRRKVWAAAWARCRPPGSVNDRSKRKRKRRRAAGAWRISSCSSVVGGVDVLEGHDGHALAVFEELEVVGGQARQGLAALVRDEDGHGDERDLAREDRRRGALLGRTRARNRRAATGNEKGREHPRAPNHIPSQRVMEPPMPVACKGRKKGSIMHFAFYPIIRIKTRKCSSPLDSSCFPERSPFTSIYSFY